MAKTTNELELRMTAETARLERKLKAVDTKLNKMQGQTKKTGDSFSKGFGQALAPLSKANLALAGVAAAGALVANSLKLAIKEGKALAEFSAITGVAGEKLTEFKDAATELSLEFGGTAVDNINSFKGVLSRLGPDFASSSEAVKLMGENINVLATASGLDATQSMDALTTAMLQFGVDLTNPNAAAAEATRMMNTMAAGAKEGAAEIPAIAEALRQTGSTAAALGISFEESVAAIETLAKGGKQGAEAGVALRNVMTSLVKVTPRASKYLAGLGIDASQFGETLTKDGVNAAMIQLRGELEKVPGKAGKAAALVQLFGKENLAAAQTLINLTDETAKYEERLTGTNTAQEQSAIVMQTTEKRMELLSAKTDALQVMLGEALLPVFESLVDALSGMVDGVMGVVNAFKDFDIGKIAESTFGIFSGAVEWSTAGLVDLEDILGLTGETAKRQVKPLDDYMKSTLGIGMASKQTTVDLSALKVETEKQIKKVVKLTAAQKAAIREQKSFENEMRRLGKSTALADHELDKLILDIEKLGTTSINEMLSKFSIDTIDVPDIGEKIALQLEDEFAPFERAGNAVMGAFASGMQAGFSDEGMKGVLRSTLMSMLNFIEAEFVIAGAAAAIRALLSGGTSIFLDSAGYVAAFAALQGAKAAVGSFAVGSDYVPKNQYAYIHQGEKITTAGGDQDLPAGAVRKPKQRSTMNVNITTSKVSDMMRRGRIRDGYAIA